MTFVLPDVFDAVPGVETILDRIRDALKSPTGVTALAASPSKLSNRCRRRQFPCETLAKKRAFPAFVDAALRKVAWKMTSMASIFN
jgi:hypothetical protein